MGDLKFLHLKSFYVELAVFGDRDIFLSIHLFMQDALDLFSSDKLFYPH